MSDNRLFELHARICQVLANPKRLEIIDRLRDGPLTVSQLAVAMNISQSNLSQHLSIMREKGIVISHREGTNVCYRLSNPKIIEACDLMRQVLLENLEAVAQIAKSTQYD